MLSLYDMKRLMFPKKETDPGDDFRIIQMWAEYDENPKKPILKRTLNYLCYELEVVNPATGERIHFYKAVKLLRIERLPEDAKQSLSFMDMQSQILSGTYEKGINLITLIANMIKPALGLLYLYGVQATSPASIQDAKKSADSDFAALRAMIQGTFRVVHMRYCNAEESEFLRNKMFNMDYLTMVRGIPKANKSGENGGNKGIGGKNVNPDSQGTLEELIVGMAGYEFVLEVISSPVRYEVLEGLHRKTSSLMTVYHAQMQGTKALSMNISIPMMYAANASQSQGWNKGYTDATSMNYTSGENFSMSQGQNVGQSLSQTFGQTYGQSAGTSMSNSYSHNISQSQGLTLGETFGHSQGVSQSFSHGSSFGESIGTSHGTNIGYNQNHGTSFGQSINQGTSTGTSQGLSQSYGTSQGFSANHGVSQNQSVSQNSGLSQGTNSSISHGLNTGSSYSFGNSQNTSLSHSLGQSQNTSMSQNNSVSRGNTATISESSNTSTSHGLSEGWSATKTHGTSHQDSSSDSYNSSFNMGYAHSEGSSVNVGISAGKGTNASISDSQGNTWAHVEGSSKNTGGSISSPFGVGVNASFGESMSDSEGGSQSHTNSNGTSENQGISIGAGQTKSDSYNLSYGGSHGQTFSSSKGYSDSSSLGHNMGESVTNSVSHGNSVSNSASMTESQSVGLSQGYGSSESYGSTIGQGISESWAVNQSTSDSTSYGQSVSLSNSYGSSQGIGTSDSVGQNYGSSTSVGQNFGINSGTSQSQGINVGQSDSYGMSYGQSDSTSYSRNVGQSYSESMGQNFSSSYSQSQSTSQSISEGESLGKSLGQTYSQSVSDSASQGYGQSVGQSESVSNGQSYSVSNGNSRSASMGTSGTSTLGTSSSMGLGPSIGYSKSYQWLDQGVKDLLEVLEYQNERFKKSLRTGAFNTYVYIACPSQDALSAAQALAKSTWQNEYALSQPLQVLNLTETEQKHLLYHFAAFSTDVTKEKVEDEERYKYSTVLLPEEHTAYTHMARVSMGGINTIAPDIPKFSVPSSMEGDIYMGTILNAELWDFNNDYHTNFDYRVDESSLMHGYFTGASRSGKTVAAMRFIAELANTRRKQTGKRFRIVVMDPKADWRALARFVEPERFKFYSMGDPKFRPIKINIWKVPHGVQPQQWIDGIIDIYCRAYGLLERGKQMIAQIVFQLYTEAGVFEAANSPEWQELVPKSSAAVCFKDIYKRFENEKIKNEGNKSGNDTKDAYARLLERLSCFGPEREFSIENMLYGSADGCGIDDLIGDDDVTVLESKGLEATFKNFIFGAITSGFYKYAKAHDGGFNRAPDQYETVLVIEEANEVLIGNDKAKGGGDVSLPGESEFEQMIDQSAGYGLFVIAITQKIADMPSSIIANSGLVFAGRLKRNDDIVAVMKSVGREERIDDRDVLKFFPNAPTGWFLCQTSRTRDYLKQLPVMVDIQPLQVLPPNNSDLDDILTISDTIRAKKKAAESQKTAVM